MVIAYTWDCLLEEEEEEDGVYKKARQMRVDCGGWVVSEPE